MSILESFEQHREALHRFLRRYLSSQEDIEEVSQEAFLRAYKAEQEQQIEHPKSFLFRIAKNVAVSQLRLKSRKMTAYIEETTGLNVLTSETTPEDETQAQEVLALHCKAVASLPPQCRNVYLMRKVYGMSYKEIAQKLGIAISTVEKHLMKGVELCDRFIRAEHEKGVQIQSLPDGEGSGKIKLPGK